MSGKYKDTLIVNLFGGPGSGKSTTRAALFAKLKLQGKNCEEVNEWCKAKVYERNTYILKDQLYIFAKQRKSLLQVLPDVDIIVSDSPLLLSSIYANPKDKVHEKLYLYEFFKFHNLNILLNRVKPYTSLGRLQKTEDEARLIDAQIKDYLDINAVPYYPIDGNEEAPNNILRIIKAVRNYG